MEKTREKNKLRIGEILRNDDNLCVVIMAIAVMLTLEYFLLHLAAFEFSHAYNADTSLYWAVGRGMLHGLTPYKDMYENKPIGIFFISAVSFFLTDSPILCNVVSIISVVITAVTPALSVMMYYRKNGGSDKPYELHVITPFFITLLSGICLAVYCEDRSGGFQVESIGTMFSLLFIISVCALKNSKSKKQVVLFTVLSALFISCAVMMKEPFLVIACAGALLFTDKIRDIIKCIVIPCVVGGISTVVVLVASGVLVPYLTIYIRQMFGTRLSGEVSAFTRARDIGAMTWDLVWFDKGFYAVVMAFLVLSVFAAAGRKNSESLFHTLKIAIMIFLASFCVGMGGQYYNHHFIFAAPIIGSLMMCGGIQLYKFMKEKKFSSGKALACFGIIALIAFTNSLRMYGGDYTENFERVSSYAAYVDRLLDYYDVDRYQYIGFNGEEVFIGLTKHLPQGPAFAQDRDNFTTEDTWFSQKLLEQIDGSDIVIVKILELPALNDRLSEILNAEFCVLPPNPYEEEPPEGFDFDIYYRIDTFCE